MKDKLIKTNRKKAYYKMRKVAFVMSFLLIVGTSFVVPYRYVAEAVKAMNTEETSEVHENEVELEEGSENFES
ncbi:MAG TPA: hypothetical protein VFD05_02435 [Bacilli bacterium]|nr:hypothetical protein [Bacilli bacterium]